MAAGGSGNGLYDHLYKKFFAERDSHVGYSFQQAPGGSFVSAGSWRQRAGSYCHVPRQAALVDLESMAAAKDIACRARPVAAGHPANEETIGAEIVQASFPL
ncbi:MAG: hypothetical protein HP491_00010 [Nitrospira sp.]|nr:hypothetical protein [Nitrospira sp.]